MPTNYDAIAADYQRAKQQPWRYYIERYTLLRVIGHLFQAEVLDLACGEGYYTRIFRHCRAARALALLRGRSYALPEDMTDLVPDVLRHRLVLSYEALSDGLTADQLVTRIMQTIPVPDKPLATHVQVPVAQ